MSSSLVRSIVTCAAAALLAVALGACKQPNGDRCQLDSDCASGICVLRCTTTTSGLPEGTCQATRTGSCQSSDSSPADVNLHDGAVDRSVAPDHTAPESVTTPDMPHSG